MKPYIQPLVTVCAGIFGAFAVVAQPLRVPEPIVVQIADIDREFVHVRAQPQPNSADLTSVRVEQRALLIFHFIRKSAQEVDALVQDGTRTKRRVRIMDGARLVTECSVVGVSNFRKGPSVTRHGFILLFDSLAEAERVATAMGEDADRMMARMLQD